MKTNYILKCFLVALIYIFNNSKVYSLDIDPKIKAKEEETFSKSDLDKQVQIEIKKRLKMLKKGEFVKFTNELFVKERDLEKQIIKIKKEKELLKNSRMSLKSQIKAFQDEQNKYLTCRSEITKKRDRRILHMVDVISGMKPLTASKILSVQDAEISIDILSRLEAIKVSKIFNLMDKEISARLQKQYMTMQR